jgi:UDP-N-acetylglucosamine diphosphorylase/glucosamine-1-phosphate N-acetyltransferase
MRIGIFEDYRYKGLQPLTYLQPVFDLRCGMYLLRQKIEMRHKEQDIDYFVRDGLVPLMREKYPERSFNDLNNDDYLFINGLVLYNDGLLAELTSTERSILFTKDNEVFAAYIKQADLNTLTKNSEGLLLFESISERFELKVESSLLKYPWEFVHANGSEIEKDFQFATAKLKMKRYSKDGVYLINPEQVFIAESAHVDPGVVIDANDGPVYIDEDAHIFPQATLIGPAYIGPKSLVKIGAKIYEGTSLGEVCKVGGEVEESIIHSYSNKQHDGFLGHAYLGQWVNLGADTNNSDLKNNYGSVRVYVNGEEIDSGSTFVGLTMGDHSKSGINTMFNTGTVVGIMCNVYGSDFPPKWIPSYSWGGSDGFVEHQFDKAISLARKVMSRRKVELGAAEENLLRAVFEETKNQRN